MPDYKEIIMDCPARVIARGGLVRLTYTRYADDGETIIEQSHGRAVTLSAAKITALRVLQACAEIEEAALQTSEESNVTRLRA